MSALDLALEGANFSSCCDMLTFLASFEELGVPVDGAAGIGASSIWVLGCDAHRGLISDPGSLEEPAAVYK